MEIRVEGKPENISVKGSNVLFTVYGENMGGSITLKKNDGSFGDLGIVLFTDTELQRFRETIAAQEPLDLFAKLVDACEVYRKK